MNTPALVSRLDQRALPQWNAASPGYIAMQSSNGSVEDSNRQASRLASAVRRYWWVALLIWAVVAVPSSIAIFRAIPPQYVAVGSINVAPVIVNPVRGEEKTNPFYTEYLRTQADLMKNPNVLEEAAKKPQMAAFDWFRQLPDQVGYLSEHVEVETVPATENIRVSMTHKDANAAKAVVNSLIDAYMDISDSRQKAETSSVLKTLNEMRSTTQDAYKGAQQQLEKLTSEGDMGWSESATEVMSKVLASARETAMKLEQQQFSLTMQLDTAKSKTLADQATYIASIPTDNDPQINQWITERVRVVMADNILASKFATEQHPERVANRKQLRELDTKIAARRKEIQDNAWTSYRAGFELNRAKAIVDTEADLALAKQQLATLNGRIQSQEAAARELGNKSQPIAALKNQIADAREALKRYNDRIDEVERQNSPLGRLIPYRALLPLTATVDKRPKLALAANGLGIFLGMAVLVILMKLRDKIDQAEDMPNNFQSLVVGTVSHAGASARGLQGRISKRILGEEMRLLHANLLPPGRAERRIMMITSPTPSNGKTSIASQLALSLAKSGLEVLLVDADLRKRDLSTMFDVGFRPGLADLLQGKAPELIRPIELLPNLRLMGAGSKLEHNPVELFHRRHFHESLNLLQEKFDCIIVDTPPTLVVADARLIAQSCDEVLCVVRAQVSSPREVNQTIDALARITGKTPKIIVNGVAQRQSYYKYKFAYTSTENEFETDAPVSVAATDASD